MFERPMWSKVDIRLQGDPRGLSDEVFERSNPGNIWLRLFFAQDRTEQAL
jgi:hypothetical protein